MKPYTRGRRAGKYLLSAAIVVATLAYIDLTGVKAATDEQFLYIEVADVKHLADITAAHENAGAS